MLSASGNEEFDHADLDQGPTKWNLLGEVAGLGGVAVGPCVPPPVPLSKELQMQFACEIESIVSQKGTELLMIMPKPAKPT